MNKRIKTINKKISDEVKENIKLLNKQLESEFNSIIKYGKIQNYGSSYYIVVYKDRIIQYVVNENGLIKNIEITEYKEIDNNRIKRLGYKEVVKGSI